MMYHFKVNNTRGFSLIELMVVLAIMAILMTLSGGLMQKSIAQQTRQVELEQVRQLFKKLSYQAYYGGGTINIRLEQSKMQVSYLSTLNVLDNNNALTGLATNNTQNQAIVSTDIIEFEQLTFVAKDYLISSKGTVNQSYYQVILAGEIVTFPLYSLFKSAVL